MYKPLSIQEPSFQASPSPSHSRTRRHRTGNSQSPAIESINIYADYAASTPISPAVKERMIEVFCDTSLGNPHARHHIFGERAYRLVEEAREQVASSIGAETREIIFTSGATESNNMIFSALLDHLKASGKTTVLCSAVEHKSILEPLKALERRGLKAKILPVKPCGMLEAEMIERELDDSTGLVSVQAVNNELGTVQPLSEISAMLAQRDILFHTDAAQALGKIPFSVNESGVDFASLSAHKIHGPQGIGALYVRSGLARLLSGIQLGGGQEQGLRAGTLPVSLCAGFGTACQTIEEDRGRLQFLRERFLCRINELQPVIHGHQDPQWNAPGIISLRFPGIDSETLISALPMLALGTGSACSSQGNQVSHVIQAITGSSEAALETIRLSFGRFSTISDIDRAADYLIAAIEEIRSLL